MLTNHKRLFGENRIGFTIVELIIVIVVVTILATLGVIAYNGVTGRAADSTIQSVLNSAYRTLESDKVVSGRYPTDLASANGGRGIIGENGVAFEYTSDDNNYCLTGVSKGHLYHISNVTGSKVQPGLCAGHTDPNALPEVVEIIKGYHTAEQTGVYPISTNLESNDAVFVILRKSPYGTVWMNIYGQDRSSVYSKSVPVGATERTVAYLVTGLNGTGNISVTQASTSFDNLVVAYVIRGLKNPNSFSYTDDITPGVVAAGSYSVPSVTVGRKQMAIYTRMQYTGTTQWPLVFVPSTGWTIDDQTQLKTYRQTSTAHFIPSSDTSLHATLTTPSNSYYSQAIFILGES